MSGANQGNYVDKSFAGPRDGRLFPNVSHAAMAGSIPCHRSFVWRVLIGRVNPGIRTAEGMAKYLGLTIEDFLVIFREFKQKQDRVRLKPSRTSHLPVINKTRSNANNARA